MKYIVSLLMVIILAGCGGSDGVDGINGNDVNVTITLPEPVIIKPETPVYQDTNATTTTYRFDISNAGGEVEVKYVGLDNGGQGNFIITHSIDGAGYNTYFPTTFINGALLYVTDTVHIPANTSDNNVTNTVALKYIDNNSIRDVSTFEAVQSTFEAETSIIVNVDNVVDVNNTIVVDTNATVLP